MNFDELEKKDGIEYLDGIVRYESYNGKLVMINNFSGLKGEEYEKAVEKLYNWLKSYEISKRNDSLNFIDCTDSSPTGKVVEWYKKIAVEITKNTAEKTAIIGIIGIRRILLRAVTKFSKLPVALFDKRKDAMDWLTE